MYLQAGILPLALQFWVSGLGYGKALTQRRPNF